MKIVSDFKPTPSKTKQSGNYHQRYKKQALFVAREWQGG
jgi:hypothetical protein